MTYEQFVAGLTKKYPEIIEAKMFGMTVLKFNGKVLGGNWHGDVTFKLDPSDVPAALQIPGATQFDPGMGRPMKQWVLIPSAQSSQWSQLAEQAYAYALNRTCER